MSTQPRAASPVWLASLGLGLVLLATAWLLPVNIKSLNSALLREAGRDTTTAAGFASGLLELDKPGPAALVLAAAKANGDSGAAAVGTLLQAFAQKHPEMMPWGGWDAALEPLLQGKSKVSGDSRPVLNFLVTQEARENLRAYLKVSRLPGVQTLLQTAELNSTSRFVPARRPGGQPLDAVILLTAYLWQSEHLAPSLQREVRALAEAAVRSGQMGPLEDFYIDILTLGKRLDWTQLSELLRTATGTGTVGQFAHLARIAPEHLPVIYTAALLTRSADGVARYLITFGQAGAGHLKLALSHGAGAVQQLVARQAPVTAARGPDFETGAAFALRHPDLALFLKYGAFLGGVFLLFRSIDLRMVRPLADTFAGAMPRMGSGILASILTFIFFAFSEPLLLKAAPVSEYQVRLVIPLLGETPSAAATSTTTQSAAMDTTTILSITVFAAIQVVMYMVCLMKITEIEKQGLPAATKLRLMENEENLFDGGLYIGIAGTATALVLQVLGMIEANLLAAYSSNLFGIVCVALVKIRHVRAYKRRLILEVQSAA